MPAEGTILLPRTEILSFDEIIRVVRIFVTLGVKTVRLTGGEPLVRRDIESLVGRIADIGVADLSMTTNGAQLAEKAGALAAAGLRRVNVSIDSLMRHRFEEITRRDALGQVMDGLRAAERAGLVPVKVNCVVLGDTNRDEVVDFARLARATGHEVRFIEFMPLDAAGGWTPDQVVSSREVLAAIESAFPLVPVDDPRGPARTYRFADGAPGSIGVIGSVTDPFCARCDRVRLTADGAVRACLFALEEIDLRALLRGGVSDADIAAAIRHAVAGKWEGHSIGRKGFARPDRPMSKIGG